MIMPQVVLVNPQIPPNTGNIARTCAATGTELHLVGPLGFEISDRYLKRAGLDYWPYVKLYYHQSIEVFTQVYQQRQGRLLGFTVRGDHNYTKFQFQPDERIARSWDRILRLDRARWSISRRTEQWLSRIRLVCQ